MRIAVSADDNRGLDSVVGPHFGRCPYYVFVDVDGCNVENVQVIDSPFFGQHQPGQVPGFIQQHGADVMLTGGMGHRAIGFFQQMGIEPVTGAFGSVRRALEQYLGGELQGAAPCKESTQHAHEEGSVPELIRPATPDDFYEKDELGRLEEEIESLQDQMAQAMERLRQMKDD